MLGGLKGETGASTGLELLEALEKLKFTGTLVLEQAGNSLYVLLVGGRLETSHKLGRFSALDSSDLQFHFEPHAPAGVPQVGSRFPHSGVPALRAVPALGVFTPTIPYGAELPALLESLRGAAFTGFLTLETPAARGGVLFCEGSVAAAFFEDVSVRERTDALRALRRAFLSETAVRLSLRAFNLHLAHSLLGLSLGLAADDATPFSGVACSEQGYTFFRRDVPFLRVATELYGRVGRFALCQAPPDLRLPDEPPGFEARRYQLTLRGKDALNPMSEVSSEFRHLHGSGGKRVLEQLKQGLTVEIVSQHLGVELSAFKPQLDALEVEGFIRHLNP